MSTPPVSTETRDATPGTVLSVKNKVGLVLATLLGLNGVVSMFLLAGVDDQPEASGPPLPVLVVGGVLGVITLLAVAWTWRTGSRVGARVIAGVRILSALLAVPGFFVSDVPAAVVAEAATVVVVTIATIVLVLARPAR